MTHLKRKRKPKRVPLKKGDKVKMFNCMEADGREDVVWTTRDDEFTACCGSTVVFLEGYSGYFCCEFLKKVA